MKTEQQMRDTIIRKASRAAGVSRRDLRDSYNDHEDRPLAIAMAERMVAAGELFECMRHVEAQGRPLCRLFVNPADGAKWSAGLVEDPPKAKRAPAAVKPAPRPVGLQLDGAQAPTGDIPAPSVWQTPPGRFEVRGPVPSVTNPAECRPWAAAAAQRAPC
jgi:hypothetical protein